ncbi:hypothetical protein GBP346_B1446 [Burkholderia pseudomallei MSHR346]|nr:hypothetical protein GBP346_B1446 [Burkholderia pseudomallei MSHR346]
MRRTVLFIRNEGGTRRPKIGTRRLTPVPSFLRYLPRRCGF